MDSITDLLAVIDGLPGEARDDAVAQLEDILELGEAPRQLALGLLALDLAPHATGVLQPA